MPHQNRFKRPKSKNQNHALVNIVEYVKEHEYQDWVYNPSENHIYYQVLIYLEGPLAAKDILEGYLKQVEQEDEKPLLHHSV